MIRIIFIILFLITPIFSSENIDIKKQLEILKQSNEKQTKIIKSLQEELYKLSDKVEEVETSTLLEKVKLDLGFKVNVNSYEKKYADGTKVSSNDLWSTRFILGLSSNITENMKFHGRLSMHKYWADSVKNLYADFDFMQGRIPSNSSVYLERAYVDWYFNAGVPSSLTIGRQPTSDGLSHQFKENSSRKSTYSALLFDGASDAIIYTADISELTNIRDTKFRFAYENRFRI